jgi:hypothetical protein
MSLGLQGYNYVIPQQQGSNAAAGIMQQLDRNRQMQLWQQQNYIRQQQALQQQQDDLATFVADQLKDKNFATGTPYDEITNKRLREVQENWANKIAQSKGMMTKADLVSGMSKDISDINQYTQNAKIAKENIENTIKEYSKIKGFDEGKFRSLMYAKTFYNPDKTIKPGSEIKFTPEDMEANAIGLLYDNPGGLVTSTEAIDDFVNAYQPVTMSGRYSNKFKDRSMQGKGVKVKYNPNFYEVAKDGIDEKTGIVDPEKVNYRDLTYDQIVANKPLFANGLKLARQKELANGGPFTPEQLKVVIAEQVNNYIKQRTPIQVEQSQQTVQAPQVNITMRTNKESGEQSVYDPNDIFEMMKNNDPAISGALVTRDGRRSLGDVSQMLPSPFVKADGSPAFINDIQMSADGKEAYIKLATPDKFGKQNYRYFTDSPEWNAKKLFFMTGADGYRKVKSALTGKKPLMKLNRN